MEGRRGLAGARGAPGEKVLVGYALARDEKDCGPHVNPERVESCFAGMTRGWAFAQVALVHLWAISMRLTAFWGMLG